MNHSDNEFSQKLRKYISDLDDYSTEVLFREYTDRTVKYLKILFRKKCEEKGADGYEGIEFRNLFEIYCIKCHFQSDYWIFHDYMPIFKNLFSEIIDGELSKEEIEIMWHGHNSGRWFSFVLRGNEELQESPSWEKMKDDLIESIIIHPVLDDEEEKMACEIAEKYRLITLPIYVQERCVLAGLKLPSFDLATEMVYSFSLLFSHDYGNILESSGKTNDLSIVKGAILPYIKFMGYSLCGRQTDDNSHIIEADDEIDFYERNKDVFIKLLDASFFNYYLYRYSGLKGYQKSNYLEAVKLLYFESLQALAPQLADINLNDERELIVTVFAEKADCYTHIFAVFLQGLQGKEVRIRDENATVFPLLSHFGL